jgi:acyl carrier protein
MPSPAAESTTPLPAEASPLENELRGLIVRELHLSDVHPESIDPTAPLFGAGLGLDSIDALELAVAVHRVYGVQLEPDRAEQRGILQSLRSLAAFIETTRATVSSSG